MKTLFMWALMLSLFSVPAMAQRADSGLKGKDAPDFKAVRCINSPRDKQMTLEDCKGEVVLIKLWGVRCPPCIKSMPEVNELWKKYEGKGLHIFMLERQNHSEEQVAKLYSDMGLTMPQVVEGDFGGYPGVRSIPYAYVIGVDGKVIYESNTGYVSVIDNEIKKIKYLGLGKPDVAKGLEKAATLFSQKQYSKSAEEARKFLDKGDDAAKADAQYIVDRVETMHSRLLERANKAKEERRYADAIAALTDIVNGYKGSQPGTDADNEIKEMRKDKEISKELKASENLTKLVEGNKKLARPAQAKALRDFAKKNEGTRAAEDAKTMADQVDAGK